MNDHSRPLRDKRGRRRLIASEMPENLILGEPDGRVFIFDQLVEGVDGTRVHRYRAYDKERPWFIPYVLAFDQYVIRPGLRSAFTHGSLTGQRLELMPDYYGGTCLIDGIEVDPATWFRMYDFSLFETTKLITPAARGDVRMGSWSALANPAEGGN